jgi:hypothetical protein
LSAPLLEARLLASVILMVADKRTKVSALPGGSGGGGVVIIVTTRQFRA